MANYQNGPPVYAPHNHPAQSHDGPNDAYSAQPSQTTRASGALLASMLVTIREPFLKVKTRRDGDRLMHQGWGTARDISRIAHSP